MPLGASAGTVTFLDLTDNVTFGDDSGRGSGNCGVGESCTVTLLAPTGASSGNFSPIISFNWAEPGGTILSDTFAGSIIFNNQNPPFASIVFTSDVEGSSLGGACTPPNPSCLAEDGTVQTAFSITWLNGAGAIVGTDTIKFQSDVSDAPEPAAFCLAAIGMAVLLLAALRKRTA